MLLLQNFFLFLILPVFMLDSNEGTKMNGMDDCHIENFSVICQHSLPYVLPDDTSRVIVKDFLHAMIKNETFTDRSWMSVDFLDITVNHYVRLRLYKYNFFSLTALKTLGIHSPRVRLNDEHYILYGLTKLHSLDLSSCYLLNTDSLLAMLETQYFLDTLILDQFAISSFGSRSLILDNAFFKMISKLKIRKLSLSGSNLLCKGPFKIEDRLYHLLDLDVSNTTYVISSGRSELLLLLEHLASNLISLDVSLIQSRFYQLDHSFISNKTISVTCNGKDDNYITKLLYRVENFKLNGIFSRTMNISNTYINFSECNFNLESFQLRSNKLHILNITILWPSEMKLYELDLSLNDMEYLSPFAFGSIWSLKRFQLAHNKLYLMSTYVEFQYLFFTFKHLLHLNLSHNQLRWLPSAMFSNNVNLTELDLSHNELTSINFEIRHLTNLRFFNLENNKILFIDGSHLHDLIFLVENVPIPIKISFSNNPLLCNCESEPFISWFSSYMDTNKIQKYTCTLDGKDIVIGDKAIEEARFVCIRARVVKVSVATGVAIACITTLAITIIVYRKRKKEIIRKRANFLEDFKEGLLEQNFLCYMSFSSEDEGNEINFISENLRESLKALIGLDREVICLGDIQIHPGFRIVDELLRCVSESCVAIFVVSGRFCESQWCQMEMREAYELNKPIILIFIEFVDLTRMPPLMLKIFRQFTRAKLITKDNGEIELVPDFDHLSNAILTHAAMRHEETI